VSEQVQIDARDMVKALSNQRNQAMDENVQLFAMLEAVKRDLVAKEAQIIELTKKAVDANADAEEKK